MKRILQLTSLCVALGVAAPVAISAEAAPPQTVQVTEATAGQSKAAAVTTGPAHGTPATATTVTVINTPPDKLRGAVAAEATDMLERFVSWLHHFFPQVDDPLFHWIACVIVILLAIVLRHVITNFIFHYLKKLASRTQTTLDDKLFPALERPAATLVMVLGIFAALTVLQLSPESDVLVRQGAKVAILAVVIWALIRAGAALLSHLEEIAHRRQMTVATFMPLIKKTLLVFAVILGVLFIADSVGAPVRVFLTSLGIGGLAFALAAQDTIANLFGSFVVVVDQPFKVGDFVKIGSFIGGVEDIGLRSTKLRLLDKSLLVMPNKSVASESIINLTRFTQRRVEQVLGLTYDAKPEQITAIVEELKQLILREPEVDPTSVLVYFRDYSASSLDIWVVYVTKAADFEAGMRLRQRLNLAFMQAVAAHGLSFAFPTQTIHLEGSIATQLDGGKS